jgi:NADPH2:quinone reductase
MMVSYGQASGPIPPFDLRELARRGSLFLTRPSLFDHVRERAELETAARELFEVIGSGAVKIRVPQRIPLREAERAHRDLEGRRTIGSTVLVP